MAFEADAVHDRTVAGEGMGSSGLRIAPFERFVITVDEHHPELARPVARQIVEIVEQVVHRKAAGARIGADRDCRSIRGRRVDQGGDERHRQIVERLISHVLKGLERGRAPGARHARDEEQARTRRVSLTLDAPSTTPGHHREIISGGGQFVNARRAKRSFATAEASNAERATSGTSMPKNAVRRGSGSRSI